MNFLESIIDVPQKEYSKDIFTEDKKLKPEVREQILTIIKKWKDHIDFNFKVGKVIAKGSLLSKRYDKSSDLDVSIYTDMTPDQRDSIISIVPKGEQIINSSHPIDFYVLAKGEVTDEKNLDNIYDVYKNEWIKETPTYENELPIDYVFQVSNFFINGCNIAISNYENDKIMYSYYKGLDPKSQDIEEDELIDMIAEKEKALKADLDALRIGSHMLNSFRHEAYDDVPFRLSIEVKGDNPHNTINEQLLKLFEKLSIRDKLREAIEECSELLKISEKETLKEFLLREDEGGAVAAAADSASNVEVASVSDSGVTAKDFENHTPERISKKVDPSGELLKESEKKEDVFITFGRFNPPTKGHLKLFKVLDEKENSFIYASHSCDRKKNPIPYEEKINLLDKVLEENGLDNVKIIRSEDRVLIEILKKLSQDYKNLNIVTGSDRVDDMSYIVKYNNVEDKLGEKYSFDNINFINAGKRSENSEDDIEKISASKMREFVKNDNIEEFIKNSPYNKETASRVFRELKDYMGV